MKTMTWNTARYCIAGISELSIVAATWVFVGQTVARTAITAQMTGPLVWLAIMTLALTAPGLTLVWLAGVEARASLHETHAAERPVAA
jgi:hypothetical protein